MPPCGNCRHRWIIKIHFTYLCSHWTRTLTILQVNRLLCYSPTNWDMKETTEAQAPVNCYSSSGGCWRTLPFIVWRHTHKKKGSEEDFLWTTARSLSVENDQWLMTLLLKQPTCYWCWEVDKQGGGLFLVLVEERQFLVDWNASDTTMGFKKGGNDAYLLFSVAD